MVLRALWILLLLLVMVIAVTATLPFILPDADKSPLKANEKFFAMVEDGRIYDAYKSAASSVQRISYEDFEQSLLANDFDGISGAMWEEPDVQSSEATFEGILSKESGERDEVSVKYVRETGAWRVYSIVSKEVGTVFREDWSQEEGSDTLPIPEGEEIQQLVKNTMLRFNEAVQIEYFAPFYQQISQAWQQQTSPTRLRAAFNEFVERDVSFAGIKDMAAEFTSRPRIDDNGILLVEGYYPHTPFRVFFELKFITESGRWRLFGINLNLLASDAPTPD